MDLAQKIGKYKTAPAAAIFLWLAYKVGEAIGAGGSHLPIFVFVSISVAGAMLFLMSRIGEFAVFCIIIFLFWVPLETRLYRIFPFLWGVHLAELGIWLFSLWVLIKNTVFSKYKLNDVKIPGFLPWLLFALGAIISNFVIGSFSIKSLTVTRITIITPLFLCFLVFYFIKSLRQAEIVLWLFIISCAILGAIFLLSPMYVQEVAGSAIQTIYFDSLDKGRLTKVIDLPLLGPLFFSGETGGISFVFIGTIALGLWFQSSYLRAKVLTGSILILSCYIIIKSQSRSALFGLSASFGTMAILGVIDKKQGPLRFCTAASVVGIILCVLYFEFLNVRSLSDRVAWDRFITLFYDPVSAHGAQERIDRWITSFEVYLHNPFFGVGLHGFPYNITGASWYAHNLYLYLLLSFGIIGFIGFGWLLLSYTCAMIYALKSPERGGLAKAGLASVTGLLVSGVTSCVFSGFWNIYSFWFPIAVIVAACRLPNNSEN